MVDQRLDKTSRLRKRTDFERVFGNSAYAADRVLVVRGCQNGLDRSRIGVSVSRKVGGAVVRNRWKRLVREVFRTARSRIPTGFDFVVRPRKGAVPELVAVAESLPQLSCRVADRVKGQSR